MDAPTEPSGMISRRVHVPICLCCSATDLNATWVCHQSQASDSWPFRLNAQLAHSDKLFRTGWVDSHSIIKVFLGRAHFQRYREAL